MKKISWQEMRCSSISMRALCFCYSCRWLFGAGGIYLLQFYLSGGEAELFQDRKPGLELL